MTGKELKRAKKLLKRKRYTDIIRMLEPQVFRFRQNTDYYYLLGTAYLYTGDIAGAATYLKRVMQLAPEHINALLETAAIYLKQGQNQKAIECWLDVLKLDSSNKIAKKSLNLLKESANSPELLDTYLASNKFFQLLPSQGAPFRIIIPVFVIAVFLVPLGLYFAPKLTDLFQKKQVRNENVAGIVIGRDEEIVSLTGEFHYILTEDEIRKTLTDAKNTFDDFRDNISQKLINKLKYSNAAMEIKNKARLIESYLTTPNFTNFSDNYSYREVRDDPFLHENCFVRWKGKISNLEIGEESIRFDFLVGYHDNKVLEGIIPVSFSFGVNIEQGSAVELIGRVSDPTGILRLEGVSIRPLGPNP